MILDMWFGNNIKNQYQCTIAEISIINTLNFQHWFSEASHYGGLPPRRKVNENILKKLKG